MMANAFIDRRKFLQWGALGGVLVAAGCSGGGAEPAQGVTTPPVEGGNRKLLQKNKEVGEAAARKKK
jgi:hypothetical protein